MWAEIEINNSMNREMQNLRGLIREDELVGDKSQETTNSSQAMKENKASEWQAGESQRNDVEVDKSVGVYPGLIRCGWV
ncbi:hypothetical protein V6N11_080217 [Hibiscus sabdariffa]|uniref:Uncharacterized protein n=1 Tax=Hibiscus sabdariffa TaxID=183260 RepID=A0ABR1ZRW7_9ROSI